MQHLNGKVVLITGECSGMGRQAAQMCAGGRRDRRAAGRQ